MASEVTVFSKARDSKLVDHRRHSHLRQQRRSRRTLDIDSIRGAAVILIRDEHLTGQVSASSALTDNSIWG